MDREVFILRYNLARFKWPGLYSETTQPRGDEARAKFFDAVVDDDREKKRDASFGG